MRHAPNANNRAQAAVDQELEAGQGQTLAARLAAAAEPGPLIRQVFISHTGPKQHAAGSTFAASILKPALEAAGLGVFLDFSSLEPGCIWPEELVHAAANSAVVVVVLTKEYTQRYWCMLELSLALHSRSLAAQQLNQQAEQQLQQPLVIPVFYDNPVQVLCPDDIKNYWQLQQVPANRYDWDPSGWADNISTMEKLQAVRHTTLQAVKDRDCQLARRVVAAAVKAMPVQFHHDTVYGFEQPEADLTAELVVPDPDRLGLWLHGMGGSGKTTLATLLFNRLAPHFQHCAFIQLQHDERVGSQQLVNLLKQLGAIGFNEGRPAGVLLGQLQDYVWDKAVLIVVDNVWVKGQLDDLLPRSFGQGSRVVITSRSSDLPDSEWWRQVYDHLVQHPMAGLTNEAAVQLLYNSANMKTHCQTESGLREMRNVAKDLIDACKGLPLALQLTGALLHSKDNNRPQPVAKWKEALAALRRGMSAIDTEGRLKDILYSTFTTLELEQQHMFLDVATALRGLPMECALAVWVGWHGAVARSLFEGLERRNLVSCDSEGQLQMHDVLEAVGRRMLLDQGSALPQVLRGTRLWVQDKRLKGYIKGLSVLTAQLGCEGLDQDSWSRLQSDISGLQLTDLSRAKILLMGSTLLPISDLSRAKILLMGWTRLPIKANNLQLKDLLWLSNSSAEFWRYSLLPCDYLQVNFERSPFTNFAALRILQLGCGSQLVASPRTFCQFTRTFRQLPALQELQLEFCHELVALPHTFCQLTALQRLQLGWCHQLSTLPDDFGNLTALTRLEITDGKRLEALPESFGQLKALASIDLSRCSELAALPESFWGLTALTALDLSFCSKLAALPEPFGQLTALASLDLSRCPKLEALPESFGQLKALTSLDLTECSKLAALPESIGQLTALEELNLLGCWQLASLPDSLTQLIALRRLIIYECYELRVPWDTLKQLEAMPHLEVEGL